MKPKKFILAILLMFVAWFLVDSVIATEIETTLEIENVAPSFTAGPSDGLSSGTSPTNYGSNVTFTATAHDDNGDDYYLAICKTQYVKPGTNAAPSCCTDALLDTCTDSEKWTISSTAVDSDTQASVIYTTSSGNAESNDWYAFVCDHNNPGACSAYLQGTGVSGSPFKVNHQPTLGTVKMGSECGDTAPTAPGNSRTMKITNGVWNDEDYGYSTAIQSDGKIVVAGINRTGSAIALDDFALVRYNTDGSPDTSFGADGMVTTAVGSGDDKTMSVAIQSDGKIVAGGWSHNGSNYDFALVRYNTDGTLDTSFDDAEHDGIVTTAVGSGDDEIEKIAIQSDGKIVAAGYSINGSNAYFALARYNTDGLLDTSFDTDGIVTTAIGSGIDAAVAVAIQSDGKIVAAGINNYTAHSDFALVRYNTDGSLDTSFDGNTSMPGYPGNGKVTTSLTGGEDQVHSVAIQSNGKIVAGGYTYHNGSTNFALARYNTNGSLDTSFDTDGIVTTTPMVNGGNINSISIQGDGKIVVGGASNDGVQSYFALARYNTNGSLDTSFDTDGIVTTAIRTMDDYVYSVAIQSDGKIIAAGDTSDTNNHHFAVARYNVNGSLDATFDHDGKVMTEVENRNDWGSSVAYESDGKIVAAGYSFNEIISNYDFAVARYNADGTLDTSFDNDGKVTTEIGSGDDYGQSVAIQSDGKIVVAGYSNNGSNHDFALARYNTDGSVDYGFGGSGKVTTDFSGNHDYGYGVAIQSDGKIVAAGYILNGSYYDFALARYNTNGSLDTSFDGDTSMPGYPGNGKVTTAVGSENNYGHGVAIQSDGKIVVAGYSDNGANPDFAVVRYNTDGSLDDLFDGDGITTTAVGSGGDYGISVAIQTDGKIVEVGYSDTGPNPDFAVVRYNTDGSLDDSFDGDILMPGYPGNGKVTTAIGSQNDSGFSVAIQSDGKIVEAGFSSDVSGADFAVVRYNMDGSLDNSFSGDGLVTTAVSGNNDGAGSVAIQNDGKIVAAGINWNGSDYDFALVRYNTDGSVDSPSDYLCVEGHVYEGDIDTAADTVEMHVCSTDGFSGGACTGTTLCKITGVRGEGNAQCIVEGQVPVPTAHGSYDVYVFLVDSHGMQGSGYNPRSYSVADVSPEFISYTSGPAPSISAGGSDVMDYSVTFRDVNGDNDVTNLKGVFFNPDAVTRHCTASENNCYIHESCTLTGVDGDEELGADCASTVWFNADAADWDIEATASDGMGPLYFADAGKSLTIGPLSGIDMADSGLVYGIVVIGGTSQSKITSMGNAGNQILDVMVDGDAMTYGFYNIAVGQQKWNWRETPFDWNIDGYALKDFSSIGGESDGCLNRNIGVRTDHSNSSLTPTGTNEAIWWKLRVPTDQQPGPYLGTITFSSTGSEMCSGPLR